MTCLVQPINFRVLQIVEHATVTPNIVRNLPESLVNRYLDSQKLVLVEPIVRSHQGVSVDHDDKKLA